MVKSFYRALPEETQHGKTVLEPDAIYDLEETGMAIERQKVATKMKKTFYRSLPEETQHGNTVLEPDATYDLEETGMAIERDKVATKMKNTVVGKSTESDDGNVEKFEKRFE